MLYKEPFVLYLNISVCFILLFLALPSLFNKKEELKVRLAFSFIFFIVMATCIVNLVVLHTENYRMAFLGYFVFFFSLLFGPAIYYYIRNLLGGKVKWGFYLSFIPGIVSVGYGFHLAFSDSATQLRIFREMLAGDHLYYEVTNLLTLILTLVYCIKAWFFIKNLQKGIPGSPNSPFRIKIAWAREFIVYMFANVFVFLVLVLMLTNGFGVSMVDTDLIGMPVFMLFVYLLVAVRSMMMYKEFEHQYVLAKVENEKQIQAQRLEISKDLHDSLGAQLTFISSILDGIKKSATKLDDAVLAKINTLSDFSENSIAELKNTLWVLNANEISLHDLKAKILNFIKSAAEAKEDVKFSFNLDASENPNLDSKRAVNLFRVVQEIVNNAVKYADASEIGIDLQYIDDMITVRIADNGRGFDYETEKDKSFGLKNIESRMKAINGLVHLETQKGKGTAYTLQTEI